MRNRSGTFLAACGSLLVALLPAHATQTDNYGLHAVPADKVTIDGKLDEWDHSGEILLCYDLENLLEKYSAKVSTMYDADNLYVSVRWKDDVPLGNSHDPKYQSKKGWAGDALQLRIKTDIITHITAWYYAVNQTPGLLLDYGIGTAKPFGGGTKQLFPIDGTKLQEGAEMAFLPDADGKGYVQEIKIPWTLITQEKKYVAGDQFNLGIELLWGEADWPAHRYADNLAEGTTSREFFFTAHNNWGPLILEPKGDLKLPDPDYVAAWRKSAEGEKTQGPVEIRYDLPKDARVTLAINDANGRRIRNLIPAAARKAGKNVELWDGLDDSGNPVPPGTYAFKVIYHDGIHANYVLSFASPGNPGWETPDGRGAFYGDHTYPMAAAASGKFVALANPMGEAGKHLIGLNLDGQRLWGLPNRAAFDGGRISLATDGKILWVGNEGKEATVYRVAIANGKYAPWKQVVKQTDGTELAVLDLKVSDEPGMGTPERPPANLRGIALDATGGELAVALFRENTIKILDSETGTLKQTFSVPEPAAIARDGKGWLVLSAGRIHRLSSDGKLSPFAAESFPGAFGLATDAQGQVYLSVWGDYDVASGHHNVKVFSPEGKLVREIGKPGGRPDHGPFIAEAMRNPSGIAIDSQDRLWVTEGTKNPKRSSVWDTKTGALLKDLSGTTSYAGSGTINPFDPSMGLSDDTVYHIDRETGASQPVYSIGKSNHPDELFPPSVHDLTSRVIQRDGRTYVFTPGSGLASPEVQITLFDGKNWRSVAHLGYVEQGTQIKDPAKRDAYKRGPWAKYQHPVFEGHDRELYAWADENGDGLVQAPELQFSPIELDGQRVDVARGSWGRLPDTAGTVTYGLFAADNKVIPGTLVQYSVSGTNADGALRYDVTKPQFVRLEQPLFNGASQISGGSPGRIYLNQSPLLSVNAAGKIIGNYPSNHVSVHGSHRALAAKPGYLIGPSSFLGVVELGNEKQGGAGEVFYLNGNLGENYLFTYDGLYIQTLFKDTRGGFEIPERAVRGMPMDNTTAGGESFGGNFTRTPDGKVYVTLGSTDARVMEVTGLDSIQRLEGKFEYTAENYAQAQQLAQSRAIEAAKPKTYRVAKSSTSAVIDGKPRDWPELLAKDGEVVTIQESQRQRFGRVQLRYDSENLYVAWLALVPRSAMKNSGQDFRLLFKTGDVVDLMLGPDGPNPKGEGNVRLLFSQLGDQTVTVLNRKLSPGAPAAEHFEFSSPWRTIAFDQVALADTVKVATGEAPGGYFVEAAIPWKLLGFEPKSGLKLKADFGVLFGDTAGTQTIARHYWSNQNTNLVNDVPGEADLTPALWGTIELE